MHLFPKPRCGESGPGGRRGTRMPTVDSEEAGVCISDSSYRGRQRKDGSKHQKAIYMHGIYVKQI